jgi:NTP pyrophosphatase (non-canonical NTP hydrolase)
MDQLPSPLIQKTKNKLLMANDITIQQAQEQVDTWIKTVGVKYFSELTNLGILMEEVGELSRIMVRKFGDQSFKNKEEALLLADEMADVLFVLICLANQTGIDLATALEKNIQKKTNRDATRHQNNEKLHR